MSRDKTEDKRIWNMDKQFQDTCLTLGGITTGIQILRHVIMFRISNGLLSEHRTRIRGDLNLQPDANC